MTQEGPLRAELVWSRAASQSLDLLGQKAAGLVRLPSEWVPQFVVVHVPGVGKQNLTGDGDLDQEIAIEQAVHDALDAFPTRAKGLLIRSSAATENLGARGAFVSAAVDSFEDLSRVMASVIVGTVAVPEFGDRVGLSLIIQERVETVRRGHLANIRRVSRDSRTWLLEFEETGSATAQSSRIRGQSRSAPPAPLICRKETDIPAALRPVATILAQQRSRFHAEWVWDGRRIFVVQADAESIPRSPSPGSARVVGLAALDSARLEVLVPAEIAHGQWPKLDCVHAFAAIGAPYGDVFVLEGGAVSDLARGTVSPAVMRDLAYLTTAPTVIRTDTASQTHTFLLPRTDAALSAKAAAEFLVQTAETLAREGLPADDIAFIFHRFIPAKASAWSLAAPGHPTVWVDGTWGLPDGLLFFPHDSFEVGPGGKVLYRRVRCKTNIVDFTARGEFIPRAAGRPWDWKQSLSGDQLDHVRDYSVALANHLGAPVETMFFVDVPRSLAEYGVLPWFCTTEIAMVDPLSRTESHFAANEFVIRTPEDVDQFMERAKDNPGWAQRVALRLDPEIGNIRDKPFLRKIATAAVDTGSHVEFDGSLLSHAYATLQRQGVRVRAAAGGGGERVRFNKLVRDLVPSQIESRGEIVRSVSVARDQVQRLLLQKLVEEVVEVRRAPDREARLEELADTVEVIKSLAREAGASFEELLELAADKRRKRGGFEEGLVLVDTYLRPVAEVAGKAPARSPDGPAPPGLDAPLGDVGSEGELQLVLPLALAVMGAEEQSFALELADGYFVEVSYFADRVELQIRQVELEHHPGQLKLTFDG